MSGRPQVAVVVPARNEVSVIGACLDSVLATGPDLVVVVAHRCTDRTSELAAEILGDRGLVVIDDISTRVGGARHRGFEVALDALPGPGSGSGTWLLSTDADTVVPQDWVARILAHAATGASAVAGLAELDDWHGLGPAARQRYRDIIAAGIDGQRHRHAYAANLAVRADAYRDVGGWRSVVVGEEHALLAELEAAGWPVVRATDVTVTTSGRRAARATGGLGDLLADLADLTGFADVADGGVLAMAEPAVAAREGM